MSLFNFFKREPPIIREIPPDNFAAEQFPNTVNFQPEVKDIIVIDSVRALTSHWSYLTHHQRSCSSGLVKLSDEWAVREVDDDMDGGTYRFEFNGKPLFEIGSWRGRITTKFDISEVFRTELRNLIMTAVINVPKNYW